jgi:hypothetical protein
VRQIDRQLPSRQDSQTVFEAMRREKDIVAFFDGTGFLPRSPRR